MQRKQGHDAEAQTCFEALARSSDAYYRAEGFWGLEDWDRAAGKELAHLEGVGVKEPHVRLRRPPKRSIWQFQPRNSRIRLSLASIRGDKSEAIAYNCIVSVYDVFEPLPSNKIAP